MKKTLISTNTFYSNVIDLISGLFRWLQMFICLKKLHFYNTMFQSKMRLMENLFYQFWCVEFKNLTFKIQNSKFKFQKFKNSKKIKNWKNSKWFICSKKMIFLRFFFFHTPSIQRTCIMWRKNWHITWHYKLNFMSDQVQINLIVIFHDVLKLHVHGCSQIR